MLSSGPIADRYGHKRAWLAGVGLFTVGSAVCAMASNLDLLLLGRAVQGVAGALLIPGALPILSHAFPDAEERAHVIGGWSAFSALALILGPLLAGYGVTALAMSTMVTFTAHTPYWIVGTLFGLLGLGAGLAVPATSMAVMTAAPIDRMGVASTTMNALRQMGMTIGVAFLGTLMSSEASRVLAAALRDQGVAKAPEIARYVIAHGVASSDSLIVSALFVPAMEHGFHVAMMVSGLACALVALMLLITSFDADTSPSPPPKHTGGG